MSTFNNVANTNSTNIVPVQGTFDQNGNIVNLIGPAGKTFPGAILSVDVNGNVVGIIATTNNATATNNKFYRIGGNSLTQIRERDRLATANNGALIQAPVWTTGTVYGTFGKVRYSSSNPALIESVTSSYATSGGSLATFSSTVGMSVGTITWNFTGKSSSLGYSSYKEVPTVSSSTTPVSGNTINRFYATGLGGSSFFVGALSSKFAYNNFVGIRADDDSYCTPFSYNTGSNSESYFVGPDGTSLGWIGVNPSFEFVTDDANPGIAVVGTPLSTRHPFRNYYVYVGDPDGSNMTLLEESSTIVASGGSPSYLNITWPAGRKLRRYRVESYATYQCFPVGVAVHPSSALYKPNSDGVEGIYFADSYGTKIVPGDPYYDTPNCIGTRAMKLAGIRYPWVSAQSGGGYVIGSSTYNSTSSNVNFFTLLNSGNPFPSANPKVVVFSIGLNDILFSAATATITTNALVCFKQARIYWPNAIIIVFGPHYYHNDTTNESRVENAILSAFNSFADSSSAFYSMNYDVKGSWVTGNGSGYLTSPNGSGNADWYVGSDNLHLSTMGHEYLAQKQARLIDDTLTYYGL